MEAWRKEWRLGRSYRGKINTKRERMEERSRDRMERLREERR